MPQFPDAEHLVCRFLEARLGVAVFTRVSDPRPPVFVQVRRVGGPNDLVRDRPRLDVFAWAPSDEAAHDLAADVRSALHALAGTTTLGTPCYAVEEFLGPFRADDEETGTPRVWMTVELSLRTR